MDQANINEVFRQLVIAARALSTGNIPKSIHLFFVPEDLEALNKGLEPHGARVVFLGSKFCVGDGLQREADPEISFSELHEQVSMDREEALQVYAASMLKLCKVSVDRSVRGYDYHMRMWEGGIVGAWGQETCYFFTIPETTLEEKETLCQTLGFKAAGFYADRMFIFDGDPGEEDVPYIHRSIPFVLNWWSSSSMLGAPEKKEGIFLWTSGEIDLGVLTTFLRGLKQPPCWFAGHAFTHQPLTVGHRYLIG